MENEIKHIKRKLTFHWVSQTCSETTFKSASTNNIEQLCKIVQVSTTWCIFLQFSIISLTSPGPVEVGFSPSCE